MGNAAVTIHHPTSLDHGIPYLESGKIVHVTTSMIRLEKKDGAAVGCGGRVTFKKNVASSEWTFRVVKENTTSLSVGTEVTIHAETKQLAEGKLSAAYGLSETELTETTILIQSKISDQNKYSELYVYVDYNGKDKGTVKWTKNDLDLKYNERWGEDSNMIIDVQF